MDTKPTDSAFPFSYHPEGDNFAQGMTKREFFALMLMQGLNASNLQFEDIYQKARQAVAEADALIEVLNEVE
ncbi:MAG: hypothetical protein RMK91_11290 [Pseudanabaenaceae cyanobacterium SKYGB_i_bin29]|nr:hypothetical protein [Pseudanabaenaceae cyanobacterium SKYG29]MDW8422439.1 hypothetical protein [Pseudanabaenaceae cyanobacterium SKYGB_i_bin29]